MASRPAPAAPAAARPGDARPSSVQVRVKPHAGRSSFEAQPDGSYLAHLKAAPVDGKANEELLALAARHFGLRKAQVELASGAASRLKRLRLLG